MQAVVVPISWVPFILAIGAIAWIVELVAKQKIRSRARAEAQRLEHQRHSQDRPTDW